MRRDCAWVAWSNLPWPVDGEATAWTRGRTGRARQPERKEARLGRSQPTTAQAELSDLVPGPRARLVPCLGRRRRLGRLELIPRAVASQDRPLPVRT